MQSGALEVSRSVFIPERRREGLEGLPRAGRAVVIISGMCRKGLPIKGEKILGVRKGKIPYSFRPNSSPIWLE